MDPQRPTPSDVARCSPGATAIAPRTRHQATWDAVCAVAVGGRLMLFWAIEILGHAYRALLDSLFSGKAKTRFLASFLGIVEDSLIY